MPIKVTEVKGGFWDRWDDFFDVPGFVNIRGLFQMGSWERRTFGHGRTAQAQAEAARRYWVKTGRDWSPAGGFSTPWMTWAECQNCGWVGPDRSEPRDVERDAKKHRCETSNQESSP